ncbi:MAG TPA: hypothetical protein VKE70_15625 [Candidatus Solibacter sp.]|nr:hypothetical protein [Candidatus Solibacter sp.]
MTTLKVRLRFERRQAKILCLVPSMLGLYCAIQGLFLVDSPAPAVQALGVGLFLSLPGCAYLSWKARKTWLQPEAGKVAIPSRDSVAAMRD